MTLALSVSEMVAVATGVLALGGVVFSLIAWLTMPRLEKTISRVVKDEITTTVNGKIDRLTEAAEKTSADISDWQRQVEQRLGTGAERMENNAEAITEVRAAVADTDRSVIGLVGEVKGLTTSMQRKAS